MTSSTTKGRRSRYDATGMIRMHDGYGYRLDNVASGRLAQTIVPPAPKTPSDEERRAYLSDTHSRTLIRDGLMTPDLEGAIAIIEAFAGKRTMPITRDVAEVNPASSGGLAVAMTAIGETIVQRGSDTFLTRLIAEVRETMAEKGSFARGWDYEGPGDFQKTSLRIAPCGSGLVVRISTPRSDPERHLAEKLGLERRLLRAEHVVTWATSGEEYAVPIARLMQVARIAGATTPPTAQEILHGMTVPIAEEVDPSVVLHQDDRITVWATFDIVRTPQDWKLKRMAADQGLPFVPDAWLPHLDEAEENIVGRAFTWAEWPDAWASGVRFVVSPRDPLDPEHEAGCIDVSKSIAGLWAGLPSQWKGYGE